MTKGVYKAIVKQNGHLFTLFVRKTGITAIGLGVLQIDFFMGNVQISADNHWFDGIQLFDVSSEIVFPLHAIVKSAKLILRVGNIDGD